MGLYPNSNHFGSIPHQALHQAARWRSPHSCSAAPAVPLPSAALHPGGDWALGCDIGIEENGG